MITSLTTIVLWSALLAQAVIPDANAVPTKADALAAIDRFLANPGPTEDARLINLFAEKSDDCLVQISEKVTPWMLHNPDYKYRGALLTAFVAGNVKSQLQSGKVADDSYAGVLAVIQAYQNLQQRDKEFKVPEIDEQIAMEKRGELKASVEKAAAESRKEHEGR